MIRWEYAVPGARLAAPIELRAPCTGFRCSHRACRLKKRARMVPIWLMWEAVERQMYAGAVPEPILEQFKPWEYQ